MCRGQHRVMDVNRTCFLSGGRCLSNTMTRLILTVAAIPSVGHHPSAEQKSTLEIKIHSREGRISNRWSRRPRGRQCPNSGYQQPVAYRWNRIIAFLNWFISLQKSIYYKLLTARGATMNDRPSTSLPPPPAPSLPLASDKSDNKNIPESLDTPFKIVISFGPDSLFRIDRSLWRNNKYGSTLSQRYVLETTTFVMFCCFSSH